MKRLLRLLSVLILCVGVHTSVLANWAVLRVEQLTTGAVLYEKVEFDIVLQGAFTNPYQAQDIQVDALFTSPAGKAVVLPVYYISGDQTQSQWKARFAPQESGTYAYKIEVRSRGNLVATSASGTLQVQRSAENGFLHAKNKWSFVFDSGKPFRGIGENMAWEPRTWEKQEHTYDFFLPKYAANGVNFFRTWMSGWNLPLEWKKIGDTHRYTDSEQYFNPGAIKRMDELVEMADSLGLYMMLTLDWHGALSPGDWWNRSNYNAANGGPASTQTEFFTAAAAKTQYKNRLRYLVARWGYSTSIGAWELFNEVDNAVSASNIPHDAVTSWHAEMSAYLKSIDPYDHLITTSISHTEISGLNSVANIDFNQKHIYRNTGSIPAALNNYSSSTGKPYVIGEFGYEWDWNVDFSTITPEKIFDYKRGLWYGLFNPTPIMPMSWWWEFFIDKGVITYFASVREISDKMLRAGNGTFSPVTSAAPELETYALKAGNLYFVYLLNNSTASLSSKELTLFISGTAAYDVKSYDPETRSYTALVAVSASSNTLKVGGLSFASRESKVLILSPANSTEGEQSSFQGSALPVPGKLEAEDFDKGGEGIAYHDFDVANTGGAYRTTEGVDVVASTGGGHHVTDFVKGEWLEYTLNVQTAGVYTLELRVAAAAVGKSFSIFADGQQISETIKVPSTGGAQTWQTVSVTTSLLTAGEKVLRLTAHDEGFSLDYLNLSLLNQAPVIRLSSPAEGATVELPNTLTLQAAANDADGSVAKVEFYSGNTKLGEALEAPYTVTWEATEGDHALTARATDNQGLEISSAAVNIKVVLSQARTPNTASGAPHAIPGKIEAEDFDRGAAGVVYHDLTPTNVYGQYRADTDVDLEVSTDEGGGFNLADIQLGEWVDYTVEVSKAGFYDIGFRVATQQSGQHFMVEVGGENISGRIDVPNTGGWQQWQSIVKTGVPLRVGKTVMRLVFGSEYFNLNHMTFTHSAVTGGLKDSFGSGRSSISPNPSKNFFTLIPREPLAMVRVINLQGLEQYRVEHSLLSEIPFGEGLPPGVYVVHIRYTSGASEARRVVKIN